MGGYVVYLDQVFVGNLVINWVILYITGRLGCSQTASFRLLLAAGFGSLYSLAMFLPGFNQLFSFSFKILFSIFMLIIAFAPLSLRRFVVFLGIFYLVSFGLGGMILGLVYLLHTNLNFIEELSRVSTVINRHFGYGSLLAILLVWVIYRGWRWFLHKHSQSHFQVPLVIYVCNQQVKVEALVDTGNSLTDPLTGNPVIIVEYAAVKGIFPPAVQSFFESGIQTNPDVMLTALADSVWASRFRFIPFQSLGQRHGLLVGFRPDKVEIFKSGRKVQLSEVVVGIYRHQLNAGSTYHALLHPGLLEAA